MSSFYLKDGRRYTIGVPFSYNQINYTKAGATAETFTALGFTQVNIQPRPDDRFYIVNSNPLDDGSWDVQPRDLDQLKEAEVSKVKATAASLLAGSDWMVIRAQETTSAVPGEWSAYRTEVRAYCNELEGRIQAVTTLNDFIALDKGEWPIAPDRELPIQKKPSTRK